MKSKIPFFLLLSVLSLTFSAASAEQWNVFDPRAMAMGGTGVASSNGAVGDYWNPASLGEADSPSGFQLPTAMAAMRAVLPLISALSESRKRKF